MFRINNNDFKILQKYKSFLMNLDNSLENIPRKDIYFKDRIKNISLDVLKDILLCSYDTSSVKMYRTSIKANIALLDFMLERLLLKKYISICVNTYCCCCVDNIQLSLHNQSRVC